MVDGIRFASKKEARRFEELKLLEQAGELFHLSRQVRFPLEVSGPGYPAVTIIGAYVADFVYFTKPNHGGSRVVEDAKGFRTPMYRWKKKHVEAQYGIEVREV